MEINKTKILTFILIGLIFEAGLIFFIVDYKKNNPNKYNRPPNCSTLPCNPLDCFDCGPIPISRTPEQKPTDRNFIYTSDYSFSRDAVINKKLVANLFFESNKEIKDFSSYKNSGTFISSNSKKLETYGFQDFSNNGDRVEINNPTELSFGLNDNISISTWVRPHNFKIYNEIISKDRVGTSNTNYAFRIGAGNGAERKLVFYYLDTIGSWNVYQSNDNVIQLDEWSQIAVTYKFGKSDSIKLYLNGKEIPGGWAAGRGESIPRISLKSPLWIGSILDDDYWTFNGLIGNIQIYRDILSPSEIANIYNASNPPKGNFKEN